MKKLFILFLFLFVFVGAKAQTSISLFSFSAFDSTDSYSNYRCNKMMHFLFRVYGVATGYNTSTDSIMIKIQFGDGIDTMFKANFYSNSSFFKDGVFNHHYATIGFKNLKLFAIGPDGNKDSIEQNILFGTACDTITGKFYSDNNLNCQPDGGEPTSIGMPRLLYNNIEILQNNWPWYGYKYYAPIDYQYDLLIPNNAFGAFCPMTRHISSLPAVNQDFGFQCASGFDLAGIMGSVQFIPWYPNVRYLGFAGNFGCSTVSSGKVKLIYNNTLLTPTTSYNPYTISGDTIIWNFNNLGSFYNSSQSFIPNIDFNFITLPQIGDSVCFTQIETPIAGDNNSVNNIQHQCWPFLSSWDPNDKQVSPRGIGIYGNIANNQNMTYTIRFQNTGNAYAQNIYIIDTLDSDLEIGTFGILKSSFGYITSTFIGPNVVKFNLENIFLPDSGTDQSGSNGYIIYSVKQKPNLVDGTSIQNTAYIYFDNNPAVKTNTTINTIGPYFINIGKTTPEVNVSISPNPAINTLNIEGLIYNAKAEVYDLNGKLLLSKQLDTNQIDISRLAKGLYFIKLITSEGSIVRKFVKE